MTTPEIRVEVRIRNNVLYRAIFDSYPSVNAFCTAHSLSPSVVGNLINLIESPKTKDGEWRAIAVRLAEALRLAEDMLFPHRLYCVKTTRAVREIPIAALPSPDPTPEQHTITQNLKDTTSRMLATLSPREQAVLQMRFGIGNETEHSLSEIGETVFLSSQRIRQIELKALNKLRKLAKEENPWNS